MTETFTSQELAEQAQVSFDSGDFIKAAHTYHAVEKSYEIKGDRIMAAEMANNRSVALIQAGNPKAALAALEDREKIFEGIGDHRRLAITWGNRGAALDALGRKKEAEDAYRKAAEIFKKIGEKELYLSTMQALSGLQLQSRRPLEAVATMEAGLNQIEKPKLQHRLLKRLMSLPFRLLNR